MSLNGIDVASYQAGMNVGEVAGDFVLVKATEGIDYTNLEFNGHAKQTLSAGKKLGVYHFIRNDSDIKQQADYFLTVVKPFIGKAMLVLDFENTTGSTIQNQAGVGLAKQWLDYVYQKTGVRAVLYTGLSCENALDWSSVVKANYGLWIAQYNNYDAVIGYQPRDLYGSLKNWMTAVMFQYTSTGRLPGWNGNLDFDVFYGDKSAWDKYAKATKAVKLKPAGPKWVKEKKTYTLKTAVKLRTAPSTSASVIAVLPAGSTVRTDQAIIQDGYRWVRQPRSNGYAYMATGPASNTLEYVK
ncbi:SH3 domain-containing protein [Lactiplantibacillus plantarum]|uniref:GH25 family lysozyme n=1 Tax=Lactiplantibacillus plantarum TaxID=1590 RepID=UPI0013DFC507|nr:GH25 family lysozyme [Lactiplantibacillus plantarum]MDI5786027.1 SH3 domain-containing protein [Lactiplantibacillus plantarum]NGM25654.1 lysin [Lactiplantibacillus plantarum]